MCAPFPVPPSAPAVRTRAAEAVPRALAETVGEIGERWLGRPDAEHYLPDRVATALRSSPSADAALVFGGQHATQAPVDGTISALGPGPVTTLDLSRLFPYDDDRPLWCGRRAETA